MILVNFLYVLYKDFLKCFYIKNCLYIVYILYETEFFKTEIHKTYKFLNYSYKVSIYLNIYKENVLTAFLNIKISTVKCNTFKNLFVVSIHELYPGTKVTSAQMLRYIFFWKMDSENLKKKLQMMFYITFMRYHRFR